MIRVKNKFKELKQKKQKAFGVFLTAGLVLSVPEKLNAESANYYFDRGFDKYDIGDYYGAISDFTKAINIDPQYIRAYLNRSISKESIGDINGACLDAKKAVSLGEESYENQSWIKDNC